ncbi:hypothetical protein [Arthrobacter sp. 4R501]|uniref:hypothetical protein n=1 Tax=Arthrobacter sp. 4R501 TaxID=2058886 RepID=UPI000CE3712D|nr:hypothetical protein [Arthrobacter sp. 4R501]
MSHQTSGAIKKSIPLVTETGQLNGRDEPSRNLSQPVIVHDWTLLVGYLVQVIHGCSILRTGTVEDITFDGRAPWLAAEGVLARQLIDQGSGYQVVVDP